MDKKLARLRRARQTRLKIRELRVNRLTVFRTNMHIYANITDAAGQKVLVSASTVEADVRSQIEGGNGAVRAETCGSCKSYLKIAYQDKDPRVDPVADDLATLALDLLVDEAGFGRSGPNLLLFGGSA